MRPSQKPKHLFEISTSSNDFIIVKIRTCEIYFVRRSAVKGNDASSPDGLSQLILLLLFWFPFFDI